MAIPLTINGATFEYPQNFDENWGVEATGWAQAVTNGLLQMSGGNFPLTADVNFGPNFGLLSKYFETRSSNPSTAGTVRLSSADAGIGFRNNANTGNLILTTNSSDTLLFNGSPISGGVNPGTQYQLGYYATTGSALSGLTLITANRGLISDANGLPIASVTTATEIGFVNGATSSIQTQLNARITSVSGTANQITSTGGTTPVLAIANPLTLPGAMTAGGAINMSSNKITSVTDPTNPQDAATKNSSDTSTTTGAGRVTALGSQTLTMSNAGTISNSFFYTRRDGDSLEGEFYFKAGTIGAGVLSITLPGSLSVDTSKLPGNNKNFIGMAFVSSSAGGAGLFVTDTGFLIIVDSSDVTKIFFSDKNATDASNTVCNGPLNSSSVINNNGNMMGRFSVPILGWV